MSATQNAADLDRQIREHMAQLERQAAADRAAAQSAKPTG